MKKSFEKKILKVLENAKNPTKSYGGVKYDIGYHSLTLNNKKYKGQRDNAIRLSNVDYNFHNKVVIDIGCNVGGMLHTLAPIIKYGVGIDINPKCINVANLIKDYNGYNNINFYMFDLNSEDITTLTDYVLDDGIDICFFLSMVKWVKNWKDLIKYCKSISNNLLIETNGKDQDKQKEFLESVYSNVKMVYDKSIDDPLQQDRRLYLCGK